MQLPEKNSLLISQVLKKKYNWNHLLIGSNKFRILFINECFFLSYINIAIWLFEVFKLPIDLVYLDANSVYTKILSKKFYLLNMFSNWYQGLITNKAIVAKFQITRKKKILKELPNIIIIFDLITNLGTIKEALKKKIPVICFYNKQATYNNLYRLIGNPSLRTYFFFVTMLSIMYIKTLIQHKLTYTVLPWNIEPY